MFQRGVGRIYKYKLKVTMHETQEMWGDPLIFACSGRVMVAIFYRHDHPHSSFTHTEIHVRYHNNRQTRGVNEVQYILYRLDLPRFSGSSWFPPWCLGGNAEDGARLGLIDATTRLSPNHHHLHFHFRHEPILHSPGPIQHCQP